MSAVIESGASPIRLGFCQRCGDPVSGKLRCSRCGGTSKEPRVRTTSALLPAAKKSDPWAHKYVNGDSSLTSTKDLDDQEDYLHDQPPPLSPKRGHYDSALGFGMPSRISRDLHRPASSSLKLDLPTSSSLELDLGPKSRPVSQDYSAPLVKGSDGVLSKVCGSLVEPSSSRNKWACADCASVFARDSTLYAAPASQQDRDGACYCRDCYSKRYGLGSCKGCGKDVLGSTKEDGKFVKAEKGIWHGKCWKCQHCAKGGEEILVGMDGNPTCEECFDRPKRRPAFVEPSVATRANGREEYGLPDVRRVTRVGATRTGPMGATIAELTKKLGQQSVSTQPSPRIPFSSRTSSDTSLPISGSKDSVDGGKSSYAFPIHVPTSPTKPSMTRSGSITGSPPKPRPLTAQFRDGLNLAAFKPSFAAAGDAEDDERMVRRDSRSRSVSPVKRPEWKKATAHSLDMEKKETVSKVPGSPSLTPMSAASSRLEISTTSQDPDRRQTSSGFPRPLNPPFSKVDEPTEPLQGEKAIESSLEPAEGTTRCAVCHLLPFEPLSSTKDEVVMVTLGDNIHLHAACFRCSICSNVIDGSKFFARLQDGGWAHPQCSPTIQLTVVQEKGIEGSGGQKSYRSSLYPASAARSHPTHQRELKPSPAPSPTPSMRERLTTDRPSVLPTHTKAEATYMRRSSSQPSNTLPPKATSPANPAAGIFSRLNALSSASGTSLTATTKGRLGGMQSCAFCGEKLSSLESVLGPRGTQWHKNCLICRAPPKEQQRESWRYAYGRKEEKVVCGKKLDSGAKVSGDGEVRCRDCYDRESGAFRVKA